MAAHAKYPVLHEDFGDMFLFRTLRLVLDSAGYPFFSLADLHAPSPKRLRLQLCAMINFAKYRQEKLDLWEEANKPVRVCRKKKRERTKSYVVWLVGLSNCTMRMHA